MIIKVVPKEKCKRWGFMKSFDDPTGYDRVVPIEFKLHFKSRLHSDRVCDVYDWFEMTDVYCLGKIQKAPRGSGFDPFQNRIVIFNFRILRLRSWVIRHCYEACKDRESFYD